MSSSSRHRSERLQVVDDPPRPSDTRSGRHANTTLVMAFLSLAGLAFAVLQSLVAPALPVIAADLHAAPADASWILTAYLLAASVTTPIAGRLGDMYGKRRVLLVVLLLLAVGTVLSAVATTLPILLLGRVVQGAAGAILPLSIGIVRDELPAGKVSVGVGLLSAIFGIGGGLGIVLAGPIVDSLSWHWLFWLPLIVAALALVGVALGVPESRVRTPGRLDLAGALLLSAALVSLLLAVSKGNEWGWSDVKVLALFAAAVVAAVSWVAVEFRVAEPLVDMRMMAVRGVWTTNLVGLCFGFAMFGAFVLVPQLLELPKATGYGFGESVTAAGLFLLPCTVMILIFGPISGVLDRRFGARVPVILGCIATVAGFALPAISHDQSWQILVSVTLVGIGLGFAFAAMANAIVQAVPPSQTGVATAVNTIARTVGGSLGTAVIAAALAAKTDVRGVPLDDSFTIGFGLAAGVGGLALIAALAMPAARRLAARDASAPAPSSVA